MIERYIVNDQGEPVPEPDLMKWGRWMEGDGRQLAVDEVGDDWKVSTVFLGLDHRHIGEGPPILWETIVFGPEHERVTLDGRKRLIRIDQGETHDQLNMRRYSSREAALQGHAELLAEVLKIRQQEARDGMALLAELPHDGLADRKPGQQPDQPAGDDQGGSPHGR
jgi:hypothetical protein